MKLSSNVEWSQKKLAAKQKTEFNKWETLAAKNLAAMPSEVRFGSVLFSNANGLLFGMDEQTNLFQAWMFDNTTIQNFVVDTAENRTFEATDRYFLLFLLMLPVFLFCSEWFGKIASLKLIHDIIQFDISHIN